jgi:meso-butanediol dehydrogenase/(S,S)-butanediol dehydrogenase/diacetyl reductase
VSPNYDYSGKTVFVTGASSGIGRAIAQAFSRSGASVVVANRNLANAQAVVDDLPNQGLALSVDVADRGSVELAMGKAIEHFGGMDVLVASAGISSLSHALDLDDQQWDDVFSVNARGVFLTNQIACRHFVETGRQGVVVNIASLAAKIGMPLLAHYSASKFAVLGWTQTLARELAKHGIRVNAICPGFVRTPMQEREILWEAELRGVTPDVIMAEYLAQTPLGRLEEPEDVADAALFLASDGARFITGQGLNTTGGIRLD